MKLNCNVIKDLLPMYLEHECSDESKKLVEDHLKECEACSKLVHELKQEESLPIQENSEKIIKKTSRKLIKTIASRGFVLLFMSLLWILFYADAYRNRFYSSSADLNYTETLSLIGFLIGIFLICWIIMLTFSSIAERNFKENRMMFLILIIAILLNTTLLILPEKLRRYGGIREVAIQKIEGNNLYVYSPEDKEIIEVEMSERFIEKNKITANDGSKLYMLSWKESTIFDKRWLYDIREKDLTRLKEGYRSRNVVSEEYLDGYMLSCIFASYGLVPYANVDEMIVEVHETTSMDVEYVEMIQEIDPFDLNNYVTYEIGNHEKNSHYTSIVDKNTLMIVGYKIY